jgi:DASS family divalent anion:Na+ symporter
MARDAGSTAGAPAAVPAASAEPPAARGPASAAWRGAHPGRLLIAVAAGLVIWLLPVPAGVDPRGWHLLAIFVGTVAGILARPLPMAGVAMVGITATMLTGTLTLEEVLEGFAADTVWLIVSAFLLAGTFVRTGLGRRIAYLFMTRFGHRTLGLSYSLAATDLALAPFIPSHTARAGGAIFPILQSLSKSSFGSTDNPAARRTAGFLTAASYQTSCGIGAMFLTSMAANPLTVAMAGDQGVSITWASWALAALVPGLASMILVPLFVYALYPPAIRHTPEARTLAENELAKLGPMGRDERVLLAVPSARSCTSRPRRRPSAPSACCCSPASCSGTTWQRSTRPGPPSCGSPRSS